MSPGQGQTLLLLPLPCGSLAQRQNILPGDPHHPPATWPCPGQALGVEKAQGWIPARMDWQKNLVDLIWSHPGKEKALPSGP